MLVRRTRVIRSDYAVGREPSFVPAQDINHDTAIDLIVANAQDNNISVLLGNARGTFAPARSFSSGDSSPRWLAVADFNNDGLMDVAVAHAGFPYLLGVLLGTTS
jgi:FG-GAP-like repeat